LPDFGTLRMIEFGYSRVRLGEERAVAAGKLHAAVKSLIC
jgi:hypothetical protein